jgi:hypothetical protein
MRVKNRLMSGLKRVLLLPNACGEVDMRLHSEALDESV